jgi:hypothetical protein
MGRDSFSFKMNGVIQLKQFSKTISDLFELINILSSEIGDKNNSINWTVEELDAGSAFITVRGESPDRTQVERIIQAYGTIGENLEQNKTIPYSDTVVRKAHDLIQINGGMTSVEIITEDIVAHISNNYEKEENLYERTLGTITGTVQTVSSRNRYSFTLYDSIYDRAVRCHFDQSNEEMARDIWDKEVIIYGEIKRDRYSGRPLEIINIHKIEEIYRGDFYSFQSARGVYNWKPGDPKAEDSIRELRDEE